MNDFNDDYIQAYYLKRMDSVYNMPFSLIMLSYYYCCPLYEI